MPTFENMSLIRAVGVNVGSKKGDVLINVSAEIDVETCRILAGTKKNGSVNINVVFGLMSMEDVRTFAGQVLTAAKDAFEE